VWRKYFIFRHHTRNQLSTDELTGEITMENQWAICHVDSSFDASLLGNRGSQWHWFHSRDDLIEYLLGDYIYLLADAGELDEEQAESARERFELLIEQSHII
jgi:hypothetical protein